MKLWPSAAAKQAAIDGLRERAEKLGLLTAVREEMDRAYDAELETAVLREARAWRDARKTAIDLANKGLSDAGTWKALGSAEGRLVDALKALET